MNEFLNLFSIGYVFRSYSTALTDLGHMMLLPQPPESWDHRHVSPHQLLEPHNGQNYLT